MEYSEKLKDYRWKERRLSILSRDEYRCQRCKQYSNKGHKLAFGHQYDNYYQQNDYEESSFKFREFDLELHVHHIYYNGEPWEAKDEYLITLCEICHVSVEHVKDMGYNMSRDEITYKIRPTTYEYLTATRFL